MNPSPLRSLCSLGTIRVTRAAPVLVTRSSSDWQEHTDYSPSAALMARAKLKPFAHAMLKLLPACTGHDQGQSEEHHLESEEGEFVFDGLLDDEFHDAEQL